MNCSMPGSSCDDGGATWFFSSCSGGLRPLVELCVAVREGEGGKIWENGIETCQISCMKRVASPGSMHDTGCLGLVHWDDPEGWYREGGGMTIYSRSTLCKALF